MNKENNEDHRAGVVGYHPDPDENYVPPPPLPGRNKISSQQKVPPEKVKMIPVTVSNVKNALLQLGPSTRVDLIKYFNVNMLKDKNNISKALNSLLRRKEVEKIATGKFFVWKIKNGNDIPELCQIEDDLDKNLDLELSHLKHRLRSPPELAHWIRRLRKIAENAKIMDAPQSAAVLHDVIDYLQSFTKETPS